MGADYLRCRNGRDAGGQAPQRARRVAVAAVIQRKIDFYMIAFCVPAGRKIVGHADPREVPDGHLRCTQSPTAGEQGRLASAAEEII